MKINIRKLLGAVVKAAKKDPSLVINAVTAFGPVVKAIKAETK